MTWPRSWRRPRPDCLPLATLAGVYGAQGVSDARVRPVPWIRLAVVVGVGVASPLACGGLALVGAAWIGPLNQAMVTSAAAVMPAINPA